MTVVNLNEKEQVVIKDMKGLTSLAADGIFYQVLLQELDNDEAQASLEGREPRADLKTVEQRAFDYLKPYWAEIVRDDMQYDFSDLGEAKKMISTCDVVFESRGWLSFDKGKVWLTDLGKERVPETIMSKTSRLTPFVKLMLSTYYDVGAGQWKVEHDYFDHL